MGDKVLVTGSSILPELLEPLEAAGFAISNPPGVLSESELRDDLKESSAYLLGGDEYASAAALAKTSIFKVW